jgi:hypothetical protein
MPIKSLLRPQEISLFGLSMSALHLRGYPKRPPTIQSIVILLRMFPVVSPPKMESIANVLHLPEARLNTSKPEILVVKMKHDISTLPLHSQYLSRCISAGLSNVVDLTC